MSPLTELLGALTSALQSSPLLALLAALGLGVASVLLSPCHLASVPLVVGVVQARNRATQSARAVSLRFGLGVLLSFLVVGGVTVALGRIAGDLGPAGTLLGGALLIVFGLEMLGVIHLPWFSAATSRASGKTNRPTLVGFLFGASLGPCTFSFMAPALGAAFSLAHTRPLLASGLLLAFAVAHTAVVVLAGVFADATERFLESRGASRAVGVLRKALALLLILGGLLLIATGR